MNHSEKLKSAYNFEPRILIVKSRPAKDNIVADKSAVFTGRFPDDKIMVQTSIH
jgi:hypothetical protein